MQCGSALCPALWYNTCLISSSQERPEQRAAVVRSAAGEPDGDGVIHGVEALVLFAVLLLLFAVLLLLITSTSDSHSDS